jgi:hypothetical protein
MAGSGGFELLLPVTQSLGAVLRPTLALAHTLESVHLCDNRLELAHNRLGCLHSGSQAVLVRPELLQLGSEQLRLNVARTAVEQQQVGHVVVLDLSSVGCI